MIIQCPKTGRVCEVTGCNGCWEAKPVKQEPVAWIYKGRIHEFDPLEWASPEFEITPLYTTPPSVEAAIEATKAKYEKKFDEVFGELVEKIKGGMSAESTIRSMK